MNKFRIFFILVLIIMLPLRAMEMDLKRDTLALYPFDNSSNKNKTLLDQFTNENEHSCPAIEENQLLQTLLKKYAQKMSAAELAHKKVMDTVNTPLPKTQPLQVQFELIKKELALILHPRETKLSSELLMLLAPEWLRLGEKYYYDHGVHINDELAKKLFEKAAHQDIDKQTQADACVFLGVMHFRGIGVESDPDKAMDFFTRAEEHARPLYKTTAQLHKGHYFLRKKNYEMASYYGEKAFDQTIDLSQKDRALRFLAQTYYQQRKIEKYPLIEEIFKIKLEWHVTQPEAAIFFGELYAFGGKNENFALAHEIFKEALICLEIPRQRNIGGRAALNLGEMALLGKGAVPNYEEARAYFEQAEKALVKSALINPQVLILLSITRNRLIELDLQRLQAGQALEDNIKFIERLSEMTFGSAYELIKKLEQEGRLTSDTLIELRALIEYWRLINTKDSAQALAYFQNASEQNNNLDLQAIALYLLETIYSQGLTVKQDWAQVQTYQNKISQLDNLARLDNFKEAVFIFDVICQLKEGGIMHTVDTEFIKKKRAEIRGSR